MRSRVVAVAAAAGLAAGMLAFGTGTSSAQPTVLIDCDHVIGNGTVTPGINNTSLQQNIAVKGAKAYTAPCTGVLVTALSLGDAISVSGKFTTDPDPKNPFVSGGFSCDQTATSPDQPYPPYGKLATKFAGINPFTGKNYAASAFVRLGSDPAYLDSATVTGIVTKGVGVGGDVSGGFLQQPVATTTGPVTNPSYLDTTPSAGAVVPQMGSLNAGLGCIAGTDQLTAVVFGTDGDSLLSLLGPTPPFDSSIMVSFP